MEERELEVARLRMGLRLGGGREGTLELPRSELFQLADLSGDECATIHQK